jgi:hypothetical protein
MYHHFAFSPVNNLSWLVLNAVHKSLYGYLECTSWRKREYRYEDYSFTVDNGLVWC